ncbi:Haemolymph juvenile hormone Hypothetical protein protein (JHBP) [Nesidiocoris tenuis]|uniref:Protein takeout n=1 Tax=Nesidiocoris tenuis TaxID=355587 RepID=A0ABN7B710_9HEMI|nr:Haemolymph juvenile hormone Hypothetical protein protein (JHBP) [Nesidiocoris tenuis]
MILLLTVQFLYGIAASVDFPANLGIQRCNQIPTPQFDQCFTKAVNEAIPQLKDGYPRLGLPPLEPIKIAQTKSRQDGFEINLSDYELRGIGANLIVKRTEFDPKNKILNWYGTVSSLLIEGEYTIEGKILTMAVNGGGKFKILAGNISSELKTAFEVKNIKGVDHMVLTKTEYINRDIGSASIFFENIFKGNKAISDSINAVINDNWREMDALTNVFNKALTVFVQNYMGKVYSKVPYDELFPRM